MKKILYSILLACSLVVFVGCEGVTTEDTSKITYYITYDMKGDKVMQVPLGGTFTDPGVVAKEGDTDVTSSVEVSGSVDPTKVGIYTLTYSAVNVDGFSSSVTRTVAVYDPNVSTDISGTYTLQAGSYRLNANSGAKTNYSGYAVTLTQAAPGIFKVSDYMAGFYDKRAGYGVAYAAGGYVKLNPDNSIELLSSFVPGWGDSLDKMENAKFDPANKTIYWEATYAGYLVFFVTLK